MKRIRYPAWGSHAVLLVACCIVLFAGRGVAQPREEGGIWNKPDLVEIVKLDSTIRLDIRYATTNNFMKRKMYTQARAFLQRPAALALVRAHESLRRLGYGILVFDGYRPWLVTRDFWHHTPRHNRKFVANPAKGSKHNRGCAVDCSLYDLKTGKEITMPSPYDSFTSSAAAHYKGGTDEQRRTRKILYDAMVAEGFSVHPDEWWHFDYKGWRSYRVLNVPFEKIN
jgi:zinc D-Ala-D-Ala dipeptidase